MGTHLATLLSRERHDIVLIDENSDKIRKLSSNLDIMSYSGKPASIEVQKQAGVGSADLFIGVTPDETCNVTCCMIASTLGCRKTVARIDNYEYQDKQFKEFFRQMGINSLVYPELLAAREIASSIKMSWIRQYWEVGSGELVMIGVMMRSNAQILNIPLKDLGRQNLPYHVVAIKRMDETVIPRGDDSIQEGDEVFFMTTRKHIETVREVCGKKDYPEIKRLIIMGGGRVAYRTATLLPKDITITIIEKDAARCEKLISMLQGFNNVMVIHGDGRDMGLLEEEGLRHSQAFLALTGSDEMNILSCMNARSMGILKTVAQVEKLEYIKMAEHLSIGTIINKMTIAATTIYQTLLKADVNNMKSLTLSNADVAEFTVSAEAKCTKKPVKDMQFPRDVNVGGLVRNGEGMLVRGNTVIQEGDHVVVFCLSGMIQKVQKFF